MKREKLTVGTRESKLACLQTDQVINKIQSLFPHLEIDILHITPGGDKVLDRPIAELGGRGVFVKELEEALLDGRVDLVVHSLKDLPTDMPDGLTLACVLNREDARDVFLSNNAESFRQLAAGSTPPGQGDEQEEHAEHRPRYRQIETPGDDFAGQLEAEQLGQCGNHGVSPGDRVRKVY